MMVLAWLRKNELAALAMRRQPTVVLCDDELKCYSNDQKWAKKKR
jgi:hypothetical protein